MKTEFEYKVDDLEIISDFDFKQAGFIKSDIYFYTDKKPFNSIILIALKRTIKYILKQ